MIVIQAANRVVDAVALICALTVVTFFYMAVRHPETLETVVPQIVDVVRAGMQSITTTIKTL
jgi:hypothetical protein